MADTEVADAPAPVAEVSSGLLEASVPAPDWRAGIPEELRTHPSLADVKDVAGLAKRFIDTKAYVGNGIQIPKPDAPAEEWAKFNAKMGVPETPDKYEIPKPPAGLKLPWDETIEKEFKSVAHKAALRPDQVKTLVEFDQQRALKQRDAEMTENALIKRAAEEALAKEWGPKGSPTYNSQLGKARWAAKELGGTDPMASALVEALGEDPGFIKMMVKLADMIGEERGFPSEPYGAMSAADALAEYTQMIKDKTGPYYKPMHPDHDTATERVLFLRRILDHEKRKGTSNG